MMTFSCADARTGDISSAAMTTTADLCMEFSLLEIGKYFARDAARRSLQFDDVSYRIGHVDRGPLPLGAISLLDGAGGITVARKLRADRGFFERLDPEAEVV